MKLILQVLRPVVVLIVWVLFGGTWASAVDYPVRPVRLVVGVAAGGSADILARLVAQRLSERLGQQFLVENRPGGGSNVAAEAVTKSSPDGYTLYFSGPTGTINATLYDKLNFD